MTTRPLPERPNLEQLRNRARELQRGVRAGDPSALASAAVEAADPGYRLHAAQRALARTYGFASWPRLRAHVEAISALTWTWAEPGPDESVADRFLRAACLGYDDKALPDPAAAAAALAGQPDVATSDLAVAAVRADVASVRALLDRTTDVDAPTGPYGWPALMYTAYGRLAVDAVDADAVVSVVRLLLRAGADPNAGRYFLGYPTPFTVLTGVFGDGEGAQPVHPHALAVARALLEAGADPNDGQLLYNRMFATADDHLELLFEFGLGRGDGGPWRRRLPDLTPTPDVMVRQLLAWAVAHDQRDRVTLLATHGVDVVAPLPDGPGPMRAGGTPIESALRNGHRALADLLRSLGAREPVLDPVDSFVAAALAGDAGAVRATAGSTVAAARASRPGLVVWAAGQAGVRAVELLVDAGFDLDALGRSDIPREQPWQTALHTAVERDDAELAAWLLARGADTTVRDGRFDGTPLDWARQLQRPALERLLAPGPDGDAAG